MPGLIRSLLLATLVVAFIGPLLTKVAANTAVSLIAAGVGPQG